ncbi:MAG: LCP family protein, partial [Actinobacteria bacterium]|nr:LCP family protein [Actinomycetota bacterium]
MSIFRREKQNTVSEYESESKALDSSIKTDIKKKTKFGKLPRYARVLIIIFSVIIIFSGSVAGYFFYYVNSTNKTLNSATSSEIQSILAPISTPQSPVTILILGRDTRDSENEMGRADTIMVLHLNPNEKRAALLSIPRDTLVDIPGHGKDKINAAYAFGGEELMIKTVSNFLNASINHYITIDFDGFIKLIDELGGVDIVVDRPLIDPKSGASFSPGNHHLTGEQALAYTRSRSTELGDIGRIQRQQYIFRELFNQKLNLNTISKIPYYFNILVKNTHTDLDLMTILSYAREAISFNSENISVAIIPSRSDWIDNGTKSVQIPDEKESKAMWERIILGQPTSMYGLEYSNVENIPESMGKNELYFGKLKIKNTGSVDWNRGGKNPFYLSYHWLDFETKKTVVLDGERTYMPYDSVKPGQEAEFEIKILSPPQEGNYILQIDMVQEGKTWFSYQGVPPLEKYVAVNVLYSAQYNDNGTTPNAVLPGQKFETKVTVTNTGYLLWSNSGQKRVDLGVHWYNRDTREVVTYDSDSGELPNNIGHNENGTVKMLITAPVKPGRYVLAYDLVHETVAWFSQKGVIPLEIDINVGVTLDKTIAKKTSVMIYNGCGIKGSATDFQNYIKKYEFKVKGIANAENYNFEKTKIIYKSSKKQNAEQLALILNSYEIEQYSSKWSNYYS